MPGRNSRSFGFGDFRAAENPTALRMTRWFELTLGVSILLSVLLLSGSSAKLMFVQSKFTHGPNSRTFGSCRQQDRRRRGGGAACVRGKGAAGELAGRGLDAHQDSGGSGRQEADSGHGQRLRHVAR